MSYIAFLDAHQCNFDIHFRLVDTNGKVFQKVLSNVTNSNRQLNLISDKIILVISNIINNTVKLFIHWMIACTKTEKKV